MKKALSLLLCMILTVSLCSCAMFGSNKLELDRTSLHLTVGETAQLNSYLDDGYAASNRTYRTSNEKVVQMLSTYWVGKIKAVAPGTAYVTVRTQTGVEKAARS